jgi:hypothetical protein
VCADSRSRSFWPAVVVALNTGMRQLELRLLRWAQVDLKRHTVRVGKSKPRQAPGARFLQTIERAKSLSVGRSDFQCESPSTLYFLRSVTERAATGSSPVCRTLTRRVRSSRGRKPGNRPRKPRTCRYAFTTCATRASPGCLRVGRRCLSWLRFSAGVRRPRSGWPNGTATLANWRNGKPSNYWTSSRVEQERSQTSRGRTDPANPSRTSRWTRGMATAKFVELMLLLRTDALPEGERWEYQLKLDGYRAISWPVSSSRT